MIKPCEVQDCSKLRHGRRFCDTHYRRWLRGEDPHAVRLRAFHGHARRSDTSSEYWTWSGMIQRCTNPKNPKYRDYGGRGITVCERWRHFPNFLADMGQKPDSKMEIDRKNNDGNYEPDNCRWASRREQTSNRRGNLLITYKGITLTAQEWARRTGIQRQILARRFHAGWSAAKIFGEAA